MMLDDHRYGLGQFTVRLSKFSFKGDEVRGFLQAQSTYDLGQLSPGSFHLASFLDPQGRVECYGWLVRDTDDYSYLVPEALAAQASARLNKFLISEDVTVEGPVATEVTFLLGPEAPVTGAPKGSLFDEEAQLVPGPRPEVPVVSAEDVEVWRGLTGWPSFDGSDYSFELLNNLRLFDLSLVPNKGCYPGQETVAKIATRRGAAYSPVLLETDRPIALGEVHSFGKKIGTAKACYPWNGRYFTSAALLRDFRVEGMRLRFSVAESEAEGIVRYFPLISGNRREKARELFYAATDRFKEERSDAAEVLFRRSIAVDPTFADAYESLGVMLGRQERFQEAIDLMSRLSEVDPKSVLAHTNMSLYLMRLGKITEAEEQKSLATVKSFQSFGDEAKRKEADAAMRDRQEKEWAQRESMFRQVLEIDPDDTLANYGLGSIAVERGDWERALPYLERVLAADPKYSVAYLALGKALKALGRVEEAKVIWCEGIKVSAAKGDLMPANQMQQELNF
jgi:tetratricopeptide (TPR) repeat protein